MNVVDIIFLIMMALCVVLGVFKGLIRQLFTIGGIIVVATLTATLAPWVQSWFVNVIENEGTRSLIAMIAAALILAVGYAIVAIILTRILRKFKIIGVLDKVLGGVLGFAVVYLLFAVLFALIKDTPPAFLSWLKGLVGEGFMTSWVGNHIYANNFFGHWIIVDIAQKLIDSLTPASTAFVPQGDAIFAA